MSNNDIAQDVQQFIAENQRITDDLHKMLAAKEQQWKREVVTHLLVLQFGKDQVNSGIVDEVLRAMETH